MGRITVIDPSVAGISGDMLLAALIDAGADEESIQSVLNLIPQHCSYCKHVNLRPKSVITHGFRACDVEVEISQASLEGSHEISADQFLNIAQQIARNTKLSEQASDFAVNCVRMLVEVESRLHGTNAQLTHLHEAGSADTLVDVFGVAAAMDSLNLFDTDIISTPVAVGGGHVTFSHGTLSVPAPAVMEIVRLHKIPIIGGPEAIELATPTGVIMLANLTRHYTKLYPPMVAEKVGYGAGKIKMDTAPNLLRIVLGTKPESTSTATETAQVLETNLDDVSGEIMSHTLQKLIDAGAKDVWISFALFKKNRPGYVLHVLCDPHEAATLSRIMMEETGTLGVRCQSWQRLTLSREIRPVNFEISGRKFEVRVKFAYDAAGNVVRAKPEFDDIRLIAKDLGIPLRIVEEIVSVKASEMGKA